MSSDYGLLPMGANAMNTTQLQYFLVLADALNYTTAAERLYITQPTLSRNIMSLEEELDTKLFVRSGSGIALTAAGKVFLEGIYPLTQKFDELKHHTKAVGQGLAGEIILALSSEQQMSPVLSAGIRLFRETHPNISFSFCRKAAEEIRNALLSGSVDFAVLMDIPVESGPSLEQVLLCEEPPCLAVPTHEGLPKTISAQECSDLLLHYDLILPLSRPSDSITDSAVNAFREMLHIPEADPNIVFVKDSSAVSLYIAAGSGVTICNKSHSLALQPGITMLEIKDADPYRKVLQYSTGTANPCLLQFVRFLKTHLSM